MAKRNHKLGFGSGIGLVAASMIGVGILVSNGYMIGVLTPWQIMAVWAIQGVLAVAGARAYAALARRIPRSGGEYRYLSDLLHPFLGCLAGWASVVVGFAAPVAATAYSAGAFGAEIVPGVDPALSGLGLIGAVTAFQAFHGASAKWSQNALAVAKIAVVLGFLGLGAAAGHLSPPAWSAASAHLPLEAFTLNLFFAAYAYSGWNASAYAAEDFRNPARDVARSMVTGAVGVTVLYLAVTAVILSAVSGAAPAEVESHRATIAHLVAERMIGGTGAKAVSGALIVVLISTLSALMYAGPRVNAAMARDGFLPRWLAGGNGKPPTLSVLLQGGLAAVLLLTNSFDALLRNIGVVLTLVSGLSAFAVLRLRYSRRGGRGALARPGNWATLSAWIFTAASAWLVAYAIAADRSAALWVLATFALSAAGYRALLRRRRRARGRARA